MTFTQQIEQDIKKAMLAKDKQTLESLRAVKAALLIEKTSKTSLDEISEETVLKILQKLVKQRKESANIYKNNNRVDMADEELFQAKVIEKYLPTQLNESDIEAEIKKIINDTGASSMKDMGRVMGAAAKKLAGKADNKLVSQIVKKLLNQ